MEVKEALAALKFETRVGDTTSRVRAITTINQRSTEDPRDALFLLQGGILPALVDIAQGADREVQIAVVNCVTVFAAKENCRRDLEKDDAITIIVNLAMKAATDQAELQERVLHMLQLYKEIGGYTTALLRQQFLGVCALYAKHEENGEMLGKLLQTIVDKESAQSIRKTADAFHVSQCVGMGVRMHNELQLGSARLALVVAGDTLESRKQWMVGDSKDGLDFIPAIFGLATSTTSDTAAAAAQNALAQFSEIYGTLEVMAKGVFVGNAFGKVYFPNYFKKYEEVKGGQSWKHMCTVFSSVTKDTDLNVLCNLKVVETLVLATSCEDLTIAATSVDLLERLFTLQQTLDAFLKVGLKAFVDICNSERHEISGPGVRLLKAILTSSKAKAAVSKVVQCAQDEPITFLQEVGQAFCKLAVGDAELNLVEIGGLDVLLNVWTLDQVSSDVDFAVVLDHQSGTFRSDGAELIMGDKGVHHVHFLLERESVQVINTTSRVAVAEYVLTGQVKGLRALLDLCDEGLLFKLATSVNADVLLLVSHLFHLTSQNQKRRDATDFSGLMQAIASILEHTDQVETHMFCAKTILNFMQENGVAFQNRFMGLIIPNTIRLSVASNVELALEVCNIICEYAKNGCAAPKSSPTEAQKKKDMQIEENGYAAFVATPDSLCRALSLLCGHHSEEVQRMCVNILKMVTVPEDKKNSGAPMVTVSEQALTNMADVGIFEALLKLVLKDNVNVRLGAMTALAQIATSSEESVRRLGLFGAVTIVINAAAKSIDWKRQSDQEGQLREQAVEFCRRCCMQEGLQQAFRDNDNYKVIIKLIRRREHYRDTAAEILCVIFPEGSDVYELAVELSGVDLSGTDVANLQEDVRLLKEALQVEQRNADPIAARRQAAAQAMSAWLSHSSFRIKDLYLHTWCRVVWEARKTKGLRTKHLKTVVKAMTRHEIYFPLMMMKMKFKEAAAGDSANAEIQSLKDDLAAIKAMESMADVMRVMDAEAKSKMAQQGLEEATAKSIELEQQVQDFKNADDGAKKSSFAQKMLDLKKENRDLKEQMKEHQEKVSSVETMLAQAMEDEDNLRRSLDDMTKKKTSLDNKISEMDMPGVPEKVVDESRVQELEILLQQRTTELKAAHEDCGVSDKDIQVLVKHLETQLCSLQHSTESAMREMAQAQQNTMQNMVSADATAQLKQMQQQVATSKTKYQSNIARLQVDRQKLKEKLTDQKAMFAKQMGAIRDGFVKAMEEKDQELGSERASLQAVLRGNPHAAVCYYLSDSDTE